MKNLFSGLCLLLITPSFAQTTITGKVHDFGKNIVICYYQNFKYSSDTIQLDKNAQFQRRYAFTAPTYIRIETTDPAYYSPFLLVMPNERLNIEKSQSELKVTGSLEAYNNFIDKLNQDVRNRFGNKQKDANTLTQYMLDRSDEFFLGFVDKNSNMVKDLNTTDIIVNNKLYPYLVKWSPDSSRMQMVANILKKPGVPQLDHELTRYLDKIDFNNENLRYLGIPSLSMINNVIRILRMQEVQKDSSLKDVNEYVIERQIIRSLFNETPFRARLLGFNLYSRIQSYTKYPMALSGIDDYINDYKKEKTTSDVISSIENLYLGQKASLGSLTKGATAPFFKLPDNQGKLVSLSDFKGKVVYLDLWASWCGPCLAEMPHLEKMRERFAGKDVAFVAISIDTEPAKWLKKIKGLKLDGIQLIDKVGSENSKIATNYKVRDVPHYVLIDKKGKIASAYASRPSSGAEIDKEINKLLSNK